MTYKNICTKQTFTKKNGEQQVNWLIVGTLKETDDGKTFIELNLLPNISLYVFDRKRKDDDGSIDL